MPPLERVFVATPLATGGGRVIVSPFQFLTTGEDHLRIEGWNAAAGAALEVSYRTADFSGRIRAERTRVTLTSDRIKTEQNIPVAPGYLINMTVLVVGATPLFGQTFVCVKLIRGLAASAIVLGLLLQGYVGAEQGLGWPGSPIEHSDAGDPTLRRITGTDPAAGVDFSETVPTGAQWELMAVGASLTTAAGGADRRPTIAIFPSGVEAGFTLGGVAQAAGATWDYSWGPGTDTQFDSLGQRAQGTLMTTTRIFGGGSFRSRTANLAAGDNWSAPSFVVRERLEAT